MSTSTYRDVLRTRHVGRLLASATLARLAEQMFGLVLVLQVLAAFAAPELAGLAVFASVAPGLVVSPLAGAFLDQFGAVRGIAVDVLASAAVVGALAAAAAPGAGGMVAVVLLAALYSLTNPLNITGVRTLLPRLLPTPALERANALDIGSYNLVEVLGPVLAGGLFALAGGQVALMTVAGLYLAAWVLLVRLPVDAGRPARPATRQPLLRAAVEGVRYVVVHPVLRALVLSYGLYQVAWGVLVVAVPTVVTGTADAARTGGSQVGLLWGVAGLAGIVGALIAGRFCTAGRERIAMVLGTLATGLAAAPVMAFGGTVGVVVGLVAVGLAAGPVNVGLLTLRQRRTDPDRLGRVLAVSISLNILGMPLGSALGGVLAAWSPAAAFTVAGVAAGSGAVCAWLLVPAETSAVPV